MNDIPVTNHGKTLLWVGPTMIPPGETRVLPAHHVPPHLRPAPAAAAAPLPPVDPVLALLDGTVKEIIAELPLLADADLVRLEAAEHEGNTRKSLMSGIADERLQRAQASESAKQFLALAPEARAAQLEHSGNRELLAIAAQAPADDTSAHALVSNELATRFLKADPEVRPLAVRSLPAAALDQVTLLAGAADPVDQGALDLVHAEKAARAAAGG